MLKVNLQELARSIDEKNITEEAEPKTREIAIIGMAVKMPEADDINQFWENLKSGRDCITDLPGGRKAETDRYLKNVKPKSGPAFYKKGSYLENIAEFDCRFFNISPREASLMDPNQRLFLEIAWNAVEDAGYGGNKLKGSRTGVYFGFVSDLAYQRLIAEVEPAALGMSIPGNMVSIIPGRVSYILDLKGPSILIDTACSSSLVAVHTACRAIQNGDCDLAITGSGKISLLPLEDENMLGIESKSYICKAFDDDADGTCMGEGIMALLLKPLENAVRDRDHIYAVIKGSALNQDGASLGITAPNALAQAEVIENAWRDAGVDPETISYIETHGTGTKLGDPIEIDGIVRAFSRYTKRPQFCAIGSVKTNLGHLDSAAGMVGLIKAVLALQNQQIPPTLHFGKPNRNIAFETSPIYVNANLKEWQSDGPRRCGVSAFGLSGTNSHVILEEAPPANSSPKNGADQVALFPLSAKSSESLLQLLANYRQFLAVHPDLNFGDLCFTASTGRGHYEHRLGIIAKNMGELREKLDLLKSAGLTTVETKGIYYQEFKIASDPKHDPKIPGSSVQVITDAELRRLTGLADTKLKEGVNSRNRVDSLNELCRLYIQGATIKWDDLYQDGKYCRISLPVYAFERRRCWLELPETLAVSMENTAFRGLGSGQTSAIQFAGSQTPRTPLTGVRLTGSGEYSGTERAIAQIWGEMLGFETLDISSDFYELGGDSIIAMKIANIINLHFRTNLTIPELLEYQTVKKLAALIDEKTTGLKSAAPPLPEIRKLALQTHYDLSSAQKRIFLIEEFGNAGTSYNMSSTLIIEGDVDRERLAQAFRIIISRHEALRTSFVFDGDQPAQIVHPAVEFQIGFREAAEGDLDSIIKGFITRFDLGRAPLLRVALIKLAPRKYALLLDLHHIITDGTSTNMIIREAIDVYEGKELGTLDIQYKDFAAWQNELFASDFLKNAEEYWIQQFASGIPVLNLPTDNPRPPIQEFVGSGMYFELDQHLTGALHLLVRETRSTLYMILLAAFNVLLAKYSGEDDIVVGTVVAGRTHIDIEKVMGIFLNNLAVRNFPGSARTVRDFLNTVKENTLKAFEYQYYPYERLVEKLNVPRDLSRNPLFDVLFIMQNIEMPDIKAAGLKISKYEYDFGTSIYDIVLQTLEKNGKLTLLFEYCTKLFRPETIQRMGSHLSNILRAMTLNPALTIAEIEILTPEEKRRLVEEFNATQMEYNAAQTIQGLFEAQADRTPEAAALIFEGKSLTYRELNGKANRLARWLRQNGVKADSIVGILVERSLEMIIAILGVLKAGGAYLPLDLEYPEERIKYMLLDSQTQIILTRDEGRKIDWDGFRISLNDPALWDQEGSNLNPMNDSCHLAYLIYTSGSTGKPKGVMLEHRAVHNFIEGVCRKIEFLPGKTILALTTISFDIFVLETLLPLTRGLKVIIAAEVQQRDPDQLRELIRNQGVKMLQMTPSRLKLLLDADPELECLEEAQEMMIGGEALPEDLFAALKSLQIRRAKRPLKIYNMYGPTETTVWSTIKDLTNVQEITIGQPIGNTQIYILDLQNRPQAIGVAGELCIGGAGVARGYLNRPELTAEKFVSLQFTVDSGQLKDQEFAGESQGQTNDGIFLQTGNHHQPEKYSFNNCQRRALLREYTVNSQLLYRTGDIAKWLPNGEIEFLGRIDHQVKLRGYRIELGEIEAELLRLDGVKAAVVMVRTNLSGDKYLCAYLISETELTIPELRNYLGGKIPEYMIPAYFVRLEKMPLTPNGKVDRKGLPEPDASVKTSREYLAPANDLEESLAGIWQEVLQAPRVGVLDNFFELGGDSLKAVRIMHKIRQNLGMAITIPELFANLTIRELEERMTRNAGLAGNTYALIPRAPEREAYRITPAQRRLFFLYLLEGDSVTYNMPSVTIIEGPLDRKRLGEAFRKLIARHESLRTFFAMVDDRPVQQIRSKLDFQMEYREAAPLTPPVTALPERPEADDSNLIQQMALDFIQPFDPRRGPLFRALLVKQTAARHLLICDLHHIISDGISINILARDYIHLYNGVSLPELRIQYKDYAEWFESETIQSAIQKQAEYWLNRFAGKTPLLNLPTDFPRAPERSFEGETYNFTPRLEINAGLYRVARETETTLYMILLAAYQILLAKYSGQEDIIVGSPVAGRNHPDLEPIIGMFVNTIVLRGFPEREKTFRRFLQEVKQDSLAAFANQDYPFEELVDKLNLEKDLSRNPLFDVLFVLQNNDIGQTEAVGLTFTSYPLPNRTAKFDLTLQAEVNESDRALRFGFEYCVRLFTRETIARFAAGYLRVLETVTKNPEIQIKDIKLQENIQKREKGIVEKIEFDF